MIAKARHRFQQLPYEAEIKLLILRNVILEIHLLNAEIDPLHRCGGCLRRQDILLAQDHKAGEVVGIDVEGQLVDAAVELANAKGVSDRVHFKLVEAVAEHIIETIFVSDARVRRVEVTIVKLAIAEKGESIGITLVRNRR